MRSFKIRKRTKPIFVSKAAFVNATLIAGVVIFVAVAAMTGKLVSDKIIPTPDGGDNDKVVVSLPTPTDNKTDEPENTQKPADGNTPTVESTLIEIDAQEYYFVQLGVFANENNAKTCAESVAQRGGAGVVSNADGNYRVYAMCYKSGEDAKTVVTQLKGEGYSAVLKCISSKGLSINISAGKNTVKNIKEAFEGMVSVNRELENIIYKFDKKEIDRTAAKNELRALLGKIEQYKNIFSTYSEQNKVFEDANALCDKTYTDISDILKLDDDVKLSSSMKFVYINNVFKVIQYLDNVLVG